MRRTQHIVETIAKTHRHSIELKVTLPSSKLRTKHVFQTIFPVVRAIKVQMEDGVSLPSTRILFREPLDRKPLKEAFPSSKIIL